MIHITVTDKPASRGSFTILGGGVASVPVCMECHGVSELLHACGHCEDCCLCVPCSKCMVVQNVQYCLLCNACDACCTCTLCRSCMRISNAKMCTMCGYCPACCNGQHQGILFLKAMVDLDRYVPTDKQLKNNPSPRLLSAEVETCGYNAGKVKPLNEMLIKWNCSVVHDGSLPDGGFEINTHPAGGDIWMNLCTELYTSMSHARVHFNHAAGCHIHVDARDLGYIQVANLLKMYYYAEFGLYRLVAKERRDNRFCAMCGTGYKVALDRVSKALAKAQDDTTRATIYRQAILNELYKTKANLNKVVPKHFVASIRANKGNGPRYRGLNLHSWIHRGTIEFRFPGHQPSAYDLQMLGCMLANLLDLSKRSEDAIEEIIAPVVKAAKTNWPDIPTSLEFLKGLSPNKQVIDWITERAKFYNNVVGNFSTQL